MSSFKDFVNEYKPFLGLLIFGNIENLVLSAQGVIEGADPLLVAGLSILVVVVWQFIGVFGTKSAMKYSRHIEFIGGFAILIFMLSRLFRIAGFEIEKIEGKIAIRTSPSAETPCDAIIHARYPMTSANLVATKSTSSCVK